jgi:hypothetical protein
MVSLGENARRRTQIVLKPSKVSVGGAVESLKRDDMHPYVICWRSLTFGTVANAAAEMRHIRHTIGNLRHRLSTLCFQPL